MTYINVLKIGNDHAIWMKGLEFYRDELIILQKRLVETVSRKKDSGSMPEVEHFQNQFMVQQKNISDLKHKVRNYIKEIGDDVKANNGQVDEAFIKKGKQLKEDYEWVERIMNGLRREFNSFLEKWK